MRLGTLGRRCLPACLLVTLILLTGEDLLAQQTTGALQFRVIDSLGNPIAGVNASITGPYLQGTRGGTSDVLGYVNILSLQPGRTSVTVSHSAYQPIIFEDVVIQLGKTTALGTLQLRGRIHELPELVVSSVRTPLIDPATTYSAAGMREADFEGLPVDRNYRSLVSLLPQADMSYFGDEVNLGGSTGMENKYFVDGIDVTESFLGNTGTNLPYNFVSEIEVKEGGYEAEYLSALGGIVNVITPSGGNEFHGSLFGFYTSNGLTARSQSGLYDPAQEGVFSNYDVGFGIGGPVIRDQLWFYAAYNPKIEQRDVAIPGFGTHVEKTTIHSFAGKLTWSVSPEVRMMFMTTGDPTFLHEVRRATVAPLNLDPLLDDQQHGGVNLSLRGTYASEHGFLLDASVTRTTEKGVWQGATDRGRNEVLVIDEGNGGVMSGGFGFFVDRFIYSNVYSINATFAQGSHTVKGGVQYKTAGVDENDGGKRYYRYSDSSWLLEEDWAHMTVGYRMPSLYFQDTWRIFEGVRLHLGLRWDNQYFIGSDGQVAQEYTGEFQPRLGISIVPDETQKIFASFGTYYQELSSVLAEAYTDQRYAVSIDYNHDPRIDPSGGVPRWDWETISSNGLEGQYFNQYTLGYERLFGEHLKVGVQGVYRTLKEAVGTVFLWSELTYAFGNPGKGALSQSPEAQRDYLALVLTFKGDLSDNCSILGSYVLSRNYGNYPGLYDAYNHLGSPNEFFTSFGLNSDPSISTGLLPNDRTHVFKLSGTYRFEFGLTAGASFVWESGTPLSEGAWGGLLLAKRGTLGRTPSIWDLSFRFVYELPLAGGLGSRLILDIFHFASPQKPVDIDQHRYTDLYLTIPNQNYGLPIRYQPAMSTRLGMEVKF